MNQTINLRAHHLLCTVLFKGKGYSEQFTKEMSEIVDKLKNPFSDTNIVLQTSPDVICRHCPNKKSDGSCALDRNDGSCALDRNDDSCALDRSDGSCASHRSDSGCEPDKEEGSGKRTVKCKDEAVLDFFDLPKGIPMNSRAVYRQVEENMTEAFFESTCSRCRWYQMGLCSYDDYMKRIGSFT